MIEIKEKKNCCGCAACVQKCPKQCITLKEDEEGFLYPDIDKSICVNCHLCEKVCPALNPFERKDPIKVYAAKNKDEQDLMESSSGGIFIALAKKILAEGGVVFGAVFDDDFRGVHHTYAETLEALKPMMRSKYLQSRVETAYIDCKKFLKTERKVLWSGTSCQIAGLEHFLGKNYDHLLTVDVICHGVPSPAVWRRYLEEEFGGERSEPTGKNSVFPNPPHRGETLLCVNFREKKGFGWQKYGFSFLLASPEGGRENSVFTSSYKTLENPYMRAFLGDLCLRPSCHDCKAKDGKSHSDLIIADYWGIWDEIPEWLDNKGVGLLIVHSEKGMKTVDALDIDKRESTLNAAVKHNPSYRMSTAYSSKRNLFFVLFTEGKMPLRKIDDKCLKPSLAKRGIDLIKKVKKKLIKNL